MDSVRTLELWFRRGLRDYAVRVINVDLQLDDSPRTQRLRGACAHAHGLFMCLEGMHETLSALCTAFAHASHAACSGFAHDVSVPTAVIFCVPDATKYVVTMMWVTRPAQKERQQLLLHTAHRSGFTDTEYQKLCEIQQQRRRHETTAFATITRFRNASALRIRITKMRRDTGLRTMRGKELVLVRLPMVPDVALSVQRKVRVSGSWKCKGEHHTPVAVRA